MSALKQERERIVATLEPTVRTLGYLPERFVPPLAIVVPGSPYLEAESFSSQTVRFDVVLVTATGTNDSTTEQLDELIESAADALTAASFGVERVEQPYMYSANDAKYLATSLSITTSITLGN